MTETTGPIPPPAGRTSYGQPTKAASANQASRPSPLSNQTTTDPTSDSQRAATLLSSATAQLSALRNQAGVAAANGDVATLRQLAERAVAIGVAAGASAESLAGDITSALATTQRNQPAASGSSGGSAATQPTGRSALGLDPGVIAALFDAPPAAQPDTTSDAASASAVDQSSSTGPLSGLASGLETITSLNTRAGSIITQARSLLAAMNTAISTATASDGAASSTSSGAISGNGSDALPLNSLAELLDQAESSMSARIFASVQQIAGQPDGGQLGDGQPVGAQDATDAASGPAGTTTPALNLKA